MCHHADHATGLDHFLVSASAALHLARRLPIGVWTPGCRLGVPEAMAGPKEAALMVGAVDAMEQLRTLLAQDAAGLLQPVLAVYSMDVVHRATARRHVPQNCAT